MSFNSDLEILKNKIQDLYDKSNKIDDIVFNTYYIEYKISYNDCSFISTTRLKFKYEDVYNIVKSIFINENFILYEKINSYKYIIKFTNVDHSVLNDHQDNIPPS